MIPKEKYLQFGDHYSYITDELVRQFHSEDEVKNFNEWMTGQTCGLVDGKCAIYAWDYERWLHQGKKVNQNAEDWD